VVILGTTQSNGHIISSVTPKLRWEMTVEGYLEEAVFILSNSLMVYFSQRIVECFDQRKCESFTEVPSKLLVVRLNEADELISITLNQSVSWEVLRYEPWVSDAVRTDQVHPVGMAPDALVH
jgi:hypothetical protein